MSCTDNGEEIDKGGDVVSPTTITSVTAVIDNQTRASAVIGADENLQVFWSGSDKIAITDFTKKSTFSIKKGAGSVTGTFSGTFEVGNQALYAAYPASAVTTTDAGVKLTIPSSQSYVVARGTDLKDKLLLVGEATTEDNQNFTLSMAAAVLQFDVTLQAEREIRSITMTAEQCGFVGEGMVDFSTGSINQVNGKSLTLSYAAPSKGVSKGGWATVAPVDFKSAAGKVFYEVLTDQGVITFCHKPELKMEAGEIYTVTLSVEDFVQVATKAELVEGTYFDSNGMIEPEPDPDPAPEVDPKLNVRAVRATDSTITIGWTITEANIPYLAEIIPNANGNYATDITKQYKVALYRDEACTDLVVSVQPVQRNEKDNKALFDANQAPPRFVFSGLEPATTYYAKVTNITDNYSNTKPIQITTKASVADKRSVVTSNARVGDMIVFENFAGLVYAGEGSARGAGISRTDRNTITSFDGVDVKGEIKASNSGYYVVDAGTEIGLFNTLAGVIDEMGLDKWGWIGGKDGANGGSVCARSGFLKIGTTSNRSFICTPIINAIPAGKQATVRVVFNAAPYGSHAKETVSDYDAERYVAVQLLANASLGSDNKMSYKAVTDRVELTLQGNHVSDWKEYTVTLSGVTSGSSIALGGALDATSTNRMFLDDIRVYVDAIEDAPAEPVAEGVITYSDGTPAAGVSVSDGFSVVQTAADGSFKIDPHQDAWYIYYSIPEDCQVPINQYGQPAFFTKYVENRTKYNFTLTKLSGGKETNFSLFCLADPQCKDATHRNRFNRECVPDVKSHSASKSTPCYGVTLGDVAYSEGSRNCESQMPHMRTHMSKDNIGIPIFQTMGNHDYTYFYTNKPISADENSSTYNIKAQRVFEDIFGPIDYSWNRGDAHIVCMRNMQWNSNTSAGDYSMWFTDEQYKWLEKDLSFVPKDKLVIFCVHIPLTNSNGKNVQKVISLLKQFKEAHIMSGHTHYMRNEPTLSGGIYEHVHAAVCGTWWYSRVNGDGCPNGYGVYDIEGNTIKSWYYKGVNDGMNDRDYQIRLYRGNLKCGGTHEYIQLQHGDGVILANVFNADTSWTVKVYEDGVYSGTMTRISNKKVAPEAGTSQSNPTKPSTASSQDWWAIGYHIGVVGRGHVGGTRANYLTNGFHMYKYTLKNKNAAIRVEATDRFGRTYSTSDIVGDYDYSLMTR